MSTPFSQLLPRTLHREGKERLKKKPKTNAARPACGTCIGVFWRTTEGRDEEMSQLVGKRAQVCITGDGKAESKEAAEEKRRDLGAFWAGP
jgi:hypothetical protein